MRAPVAGSCTGTAVQLHGWTIREKCSVPRICSSASRASAVPGALVPAPRSLQSAPGTKFIVSALRQALRSPSTQSSVPSAAVTATTTPASVASSTSRRRMTGRADANGWQARIRSRAAHRRGLGAAEVGVDAGGQAAPPALGHHTTQRGGGPDQPVRRRRAREPRAASKTTAGPLPGRPRSSRFPPAITLLARTQFVQVDVRGRHNSSISPVSGRDFWPPHAEFCTRAVVAARSRPWCRTRRGKQCPP